MNFENIIGNNKIKEILTKSIKLNKTSHSYMFVGIEGIGKSLIAKEFAKMLLCLEDEKSCDKCKSCIQFSSDNNPDFSYIEPDGKNIKIEQIRNMQAKIAEKPIISNNKVYIINNADTMTKEAQNCLLKTLEEPPEYVTIILIGSNENNFLSTIKSRCTILHFESIQNEDIKKYMKQNYEVNAITENMLNMFQGSIGKAILLMEKKDLYKQVDEIIENLLNKDLIEILKSAEIIYKSKEDIFEILDYINIVLFNLCKKDSRYLNTLNIVEETKKRLKASSNYDMSIDNLFFKLKERM